MKTQLAKLADNNKKYLAEQAEQALLERLPVDQKTLNRAIKLLEPKNLKRMGILVIAGSAVISIAGTLGRDRVFKAAVAHEMKKQLEPIRKKLNELEAQNTVLWEQNEELKEKLAALQQESLPKE